MIVGDRLVIDAGEEGTDESVGGVRSESELLRTLVAPEVERHRLAHDLGHRHAPARSPAHQLLVGRLGKAQVGGPVGRHRGIMI
jgi:urease accessory protein UreE